jgi:DNA-binding transcriptional MerR regulator
MAIQGEFFEVKARVSALAGTDDARAEAMYPVDLESGIITAPSAKRGMKDLSIPKLYYSISEVSRLTGLEQYVLRYWETVFDELRPQKNRAGNRVYSNKDIKFILRIKELLREQRYTIEGAKQLLKESRHLEKEAESVNSEEDIQAPDPSQMKMIPEPPPATYQIAAKDVEEIKSALETLKGIFGKRG